MTIYTAIGLMSGTSLDGVDAALLRTDGEERIEAGPAFHRPYVRADKVWIRRAIAAALEGRDRAVDIENAEKAVTRAHVDVVRELLAANSLEPNEINLIGFHGQTILHRPARSAESIGRTWQIGDPERLAAETGVDVIAGFRTADVEAGGEGAPFAPAYHAALARKFAAADGRAGETPVGVINLGGVANMTFVPANARNVDLMAFDCGPGNGLLDQWMEEKSGEPIDRDGKAARAGKANDEALRTLLLHPFLRRQPPKSLDRYDFKLDPVKSLSITDGAATLTAFTAACIARGAESFPEAPAAWIVAGGGRRNPAMMTAIAAVLEAPVLSAEDAGWRGDDLEAECFAYLAVRSLRRLPLSYPKTTGVPAPTTGGELHKADAAPTTS